MSESIYLASSQRNPRQPAVALVTVLAQQPGVAVGRLMTLLEASRG